MKYLKFQRTVPKERAKNREQQISYFPGCWMLFQINLKNFDYSIVTFLGAFCICGKFIFLKSRQKDGIFETQLKLHLKNCLTPIMSEPAHEFLTQN
jgi:hypothetical protein